MEGAATAFASAAALGHADAQTALGVMKMKGLGKFYCSSHMSYSS